MAASLAAGVADLGLLNLSLVPRVLAAEESVVLTPAPSPEPGSPSIPRSAAAPTTGTAVEAVAAGAEASANETMADTRGSTGLATPQVADAPAAEVPAAIAPSSPQGTPGDSGGPADVVASANVNEAPGAASQVAAADTRAPYASQGEPELVLLFRTGDNNLTPEARASLRSFAAMLRDDASAFVTVEGHADERGRSEVNRELAAARADVVAARLESLPFPRSRIKVDSFGEDRPVVEGQGDEALQQNRCVVVRVARGRP